MSIRINPYLMLDGRAKEAVAFYEQTLDAKLQMIQTFGGMPSDPNRPMPEEAKERSAHALLKIGDSDLMISDIFPGMSLDMGDQVNICIMIDGKERTEHLYNALQQGGEVKMPLAETSWSKGYAIVKDKFGITFHLSTE